MRRALRPIPVIIFGVAFMAAWADVAADLRAGADGVPWRPFFHHLVSAISVLAYVGVIARVDRTFPFECGRRLQMAGAHAVNSVGFALAHIGWTLAVFAIGDAIEGTRTRLSVQPWVMEYGREAIIYVILLALVRFSAHRAPPAATNVVVSDRGASHVVPVADIVWLEAAKNYVVVHTRARAFTHRGVLRKLARALPQDFLQVSRSAVVNCACIARMVPDGPRDKVVELDTGARVRVGRGRAADVGRALTDGNQGRRA